MPSQPECPMTNCSVPPKTKKIDNLPIYGGANLNVVSPSGRTRASSWSGPGAKFTERSLATVVSAFSDGQGAQGTLTAGLEMYNAGIPAMAKSYGWECTDPIIPLTGEETIPQGEPNEAEKYNVRNCMAVGTKLGILSAAMKKSVDDTNGLLVNLGGDHSCAAPSISAMLEKYPNLRVIWVDAHADCNTPETSPSKNYHGMVLAHLMGWFKEKLPGFEWMNTDKLTSDRVGYVGLRDVDEGERKLLHESACTYFSMQSLGETFIGDAMDHLIKTLDPEGIHPFHISFDVDGADPSVAPGSGTLCEGGLTYAQSLRIVEKVAKTGRLVSLDIMEVNIDLDTKEEPMHGDDPSIESEYKTVKFALHLIRAAMGYVAL